MQRGLEKTPDGLSGIGHVGLEQKVDTLCSEIEGK